MTDKSKFELFYSDKKPNSDKYMRTWESLPEDLMSNLEFTPSKIKAELDKYVIGQHAAKKVLSIAAFNRFIRFNNALQEREVNIQKSNVLMIGETGVGKTYLLQTLSRILGAPLAIADATQVTCRGYVGGNISDFVASLYTESDAMLNKLDLRLNKKLFQKYTEFGIIYIDEVDKLATASGGSGRDVSGKSVQEELIKMVEGSTYKLPTRCSLEEIDTTNILFICGGRFGGLSDIVQRRISKNDTAIGFHAAQESSDGLDSDELLDQVTPDDLNNFGLMREFIGRLHNITNLNQLKKTDLLTILNEAKGGLVEQYSELFGAYGIDVTFGDDVLDLIAERAHARKTGARALKSTMDELLLEVQYRLPDLIGKYDKITLDTKTLKDKFDVSID